MKGTILIS